MSLDDGLLARLDGFKSGRIKRKAKKLREADVEAHLCAEVKARGGLPYKFTSPSRRSVPDRLCLFPIPPEHREIVARYVVFDELKAPKVPPSESQIKEHNLLREMGFFVVVHDHPSVIDAFFKNEFQRDLFA